MRVDFDMVFEPGPDPSGGAWKDEWAEYLAACQPELQSICTLIQQSNELALKAKICSVSPFLLLLGSERKFSTTSKDIDFSEFKTLDAVELPGAVNTLCSEPLSDKFIQSYTDIRSLRNKVAHLGYLGKQFSPEELLHTLVSQYVELWKHRNWLSDRRRFASQTRLSFFHDGRWSSAANDVMYELPYNIRIFTKSEFKLLFKHEKHAKRYLCHGCNDSATTKGTARADLLDCKTAFLDKEGKILRCVMCGGDFKVARNRCRDCTGNVVGDNGDDYAGWCHVCGGEGAAA